MVHRESAMAVRLDPAVVTRMVLACGVAIALACLTGCAGRKEMTVRLVRQSHGAELYMRMCAVCHGAEGQGYVADRAPRLAGREFLASVSDAALRRAIVDGRPGTTMSAWGRDHGGPLGAKEVDAIIVFMRLWTAAPRAVLNERPLSGDAVRGGRIYDRECLRCHGAAGVGGPNVRIGDPRLRADFSDGYFRYAIARGRGRTPMPSFAATLDPVAIDDLVARLRAFQAVGAEQAQRSPAAPPAVAPPLPLGPVPLNPGGPQPVGFQVQPATTPCDVVKAQLDRGARMALLDARAPSDFVNEHIAGAVSVPFYDPKPYFASLPKDVWYVCYCACPHAESGQLAHRLVEAGFKKVTVLDEGLGVWHSRGYPVRSGMDP